MSHIKNVRYAWAGAMLLAAIGCHDLLTVQNPQAFTNEAANSPGLLPAVAAGAEGGMQVAVGDLATMSGMLSDELWHTGTWSDWLDVSNGTIRKNWPFDGAFTFPENQMLQARGAAESASKRFENVLGKDAAHTSPLFITSEMARAWADMELAMAVCQIPSTAGAAPVSDTAIFKQAADTFAMLIPLIQNAQYTADADRQARLNQARAGLARADLMLGKYDEAMANAQLVPPGFLYNAVYSINSGFQNNQMANQGNANYNRSFSIRASIWGSLIDTVDFAMLDPYSGKPDPRILLGHDNNDSLGYARGSDGVTAFYSIGKYPSLASPIALTKYEEMNLIIAEVKWHLNDYAGAVAAMNINREEVSLPDLTVPTTGNVSTQVRDMILQERFAVMFAEGSRLQDLYRFGLINARLGPGRATKLPLSRTEQLTNPHIGPQKETCPAVS
jgi:SusD/RagB-like outer membrane lipoprotein